MVLALLPAPLSLSLSMQWYTYLDRSGVICSGFLSIHYNLMRMESIDLRIRDTIKFYGRILNEESDRASISALRNRCNFTFENNRFRAHQILSREIDGTSDSRAESEVPPIP
jgi:hypothetical protein